MSNGQLKSIIERVLRLDVENPCDIIPMLRPKMARLEYVISPFVEAGVHRTVALDRAATAGARLLGVRNDTVNSRANMAKRRGSVELAFNDISKWSYNEPWPVPEFVSDWVGFVYVMAAVDFPDVYKIGFSRDPGRRLKELSSKHNIQLSLVHARAATELDEHLVHHHLEKYRLANEWFDLGGTFLSKSPVMRFYTPERMWNEITGRMASLNREADELMTLSASLSEAAGSGRAGA